MPVSIPHQRPGISTFVESTRLGAWQVWCWLFADSYLTLADFSEIGPQTSSSFIGQRQFLDGHVAAALRGDRLDS